MMRRAPEQKGGCGGLESRRGREGEKGVGRTESPIPADMGEIGVVHGKIAN